MEFRNNDPGAVQFGNFINYYQFNAPSERLKLLPCDKQIWLQNSTEVKSQPKPYLVLDVGCNSGDLTLLLWKHIAACTGRTVFVLGIDIDQALIERARKVNTSKEGNIQYACIDVMQEQTDTNVFLNFLASHANSTHTFDAVCCFSITMWIHLNHHDSGLQTFLRKMSDWSQLLVLEAQPWKCYQKAERRLKKSGEIFPLYSQLKWRSHVEEEIKTYMKLELGRHIIYECPKTKWQRQICFYR